MCVYAVQCRARAEGIGPSARATTSHFNCAFLNLFAGRVKMLWTAKADYLCIPRATAH
jgi:hypothetical protein